MLSLALVSQGVFFFCFVFFVGYVVHLALIDVSAHIDMAALIDKAPLPKNNKSNELSTRAKTSDGNPKKGHRRLR